VAVQAAVHGYGSRPLTFEANKGQTASQVKFLSRGSGYALFLTPTEAVFTLQAPTDNLAVPKIHSPRSAIPSTSVLRMKLVGAGISEPIGQDRLPGTSSYFIGSDRSKWRTGIETYRKVRYRGIYPGVDLIYYGNQ